MGLDVSRTVAEIAYLENGEVKSGGRIELMHATLARWAATQLRATDHVVLEATGNTTAVVNAVRLHVSAGDRRESVSGSADRGGAREDRQD